MRKMSPKCRSFRILSDLNNNNKITVLSKKESYQIDNNLEEKFIKIKEEHLARERMSKLSTKSSILI